MRSDNRVEMSVGDVTAVTGLAGLAILETFSQEMSYADGVKQLAARGRGVADFIELTTDIATLVGSGVLRDQAGLAPALAQSQNQFDAAWIHIEMLNDRARTESYLRAIREVVRPGDVVVDIGTGTGVLAVAAAQAGARRVYAVEASSIGRAASAVFAANGVADRVELVEGYSTRVSLPEPADVLVSEIIGHDPLGERVLEVTRDAAIRFLKPDARFVPSVLTVYAYPVQADDGLIAKLTFTTDATRDWRDWYGIDFSPLVAVQPPAPYGTIAKQKRLAQLNRVGDDVVLLRREFRLKEPPVVDVTRVLTASCDGRVDGVALYFELTLSPSVTFSTDPARLRPESSWSHAVWMLPDPVRVRAGDMLSVTYRHGTKPSGLDVRRRERSAE